MPLVCWRRFILCNENIASCNFRFSHAFDPIHIFGVRYFVFAFFVVGGVFSSFSSFKWAHRFSSLIWSSMSFMCAHHRSHASTHTHTLSHVWIASEVWATSRHISDINLHVHAASIVCSSRVYSHINLPSFNLILLPLLESLNNWLEFAVKVQA